MIEKPEKQNNTLEKLNKAHYKNDLSEEEFTTLLKTAQNILAR